MYGHDAEVEFKPTLRRAPGSIFLRIIEEQKIAWSSRTTKWKSV